MKIHKRNIKGSYLSEWLKDTWRMLDSMSIDGTYEVLINKVNPNRTISQNRYYWFVLEMIGDETGESKEIIHERMRERFLRVEDENGTYNMGTSQLDTGEFKNYLDNIIDFAESFLGIMVPSSDEVYK